MSVRLTEAQGDARYYLNTTTLDHITIPTDVLDMNNQRITNVGNAAAATDALSWVVADTIYYKQNVPLNDITAPDGDLSMNTYKITDLVDPTSNQDAATKAYVDN